MLSKYTVLLTHPLLTKIRGSLARDANLPLALKLHKTFQYVRSSLAGPLYLRACTRVGARPRAVGQPLIENRGQIIIGDDFNVNSSFARVQFRTSANAVLDIGDDVRVNFGTSLAALRSVKIGDHTQIGPYCIIADTEWVDAMPDNDLDVRPQPIVIAERVWLAGRVTVLPGAIIGAGSVITAGSIVAGEIPPGVVAGGNPARVLRLLSADDHTVKTSDEDSPDAADALSQVACITPETTEPQLMGVAISDFTIDELAGQLRHNGNRPSVGCEVAPFGQPVQTLLELGNRPDDQLPDFAVVWTRPETISPGFKRLCSFERVELLEILADVDGFCDLVSASTRRLRFVFVPTWVRPSFDRGLGLMDMRPGEGVANALLHMNLRLAERFAQQPNVHLLNAQPWIESVGEQAFSPKLWYMGKIPYSDQVFACAAADINAALDNLTGQTRKLLVLDLDDTLWGGTVGEVGWENLRLGGHDSTGEALVDFQHHIKRLKRRGVVLGIVSKNDESVALEAIKSHPEMVLKLDDFVGWRISWNDKARSIAELATELNLGLQSVVFIDDNPVERARVREALPEVLVPEWPNDKLLYTSALLALRCFDSHATSAEDERRTEMYAQERDRENLRREMTSVEQWLRTLGTLVRVEELNAANFPRTLQLLNKTNQMNLSTRRLTELELKAWADEPGHTVWTFTVSDRLGDAGLTGILSTAIRNSVVEIVDFVLSCRVIGRGVEETMLHFAIEQARSHGSSIVAAQYAPTAKNGPCLEFLQRAGLEHEPATHRFTWLTPRPYPLPDSIQLEVPVH